MGFTFATCEVGRGIDFINQMYPSYQDFKKEDLPFFCKLLEEDVLRVQDPNFHQPCRVIAGNNYKADRDGQRVQKAISELKNHPKINEEVK